MYTHVCASVCIHTYTHTHIHTLTHTHTCVYTYTCIHSAQSASNSASLVFFCVWCVCFYQFCSILFVHIHVGAGKIVERSENDPQHIATHCNTLQHTATHCNTLQHTATHCYTLLHTATHCNTLQHTATHCHTLRRTASHRNTQELERIVERGESFDQSLQALDAPHERHPSHQHEHHPSHQHDTIMCGSSTLLDSNTSPYYYKNISKHISP